jgi:hypothetical protein
VTTLSLEERQALLEKIGAPRDVLQTNAEHIGSDACRGCHASEYETWVASPHAASVATLSKRGESTNADCLACHTTGFGRPGGFPKDGLMQSNTDLARVGCESCHGPGAEHARQSTPKTGNIVSLGDKCDSCVILQICGRCHDEANDPGFEFEVIEKINAQRHGTTEPGTDKPKAASAAIPDAADLALSIPAIQHAFDRPSEGVSTWTPH